MSTDVLVLGSASPRRSELLEAIDVPHQTIPARVEEPAPGTLPAEELVLASALVKGRAVAARHAGRLVLAADTMVVLGDDVLGKPKDAHDARGMLASLSGRQHRVLTGVALLRAGEQAVTRLGQTHVRFRELTPSFIERYVATGEPLDKAGSYGAQGLMGTQIEGIEGSWTNVVGLPLELLPELFAAVGEELAEWQDW